MNTCKVKLIFRRIFLYGKQLFPIHGKNTHKNEKKKELPLTKLPTLLKGKKTHSQYSVAFLSKGKSNNVLKLYVKCGEQREQGKRKNELSKERNVSCPVLWKIQRQPSWDNNLFI